MDINEATAKALQAARAVSGMTYEEIAQRSGVSAPTVYRMFSAKRDIKLPQLYSIAQVMGVTIVDIMQDAERIRVRDERNKKSEKDREALIDRVVMDPESFGVAALHDENKSRENQGGEGR